MKKTSKKDDDNSKGLHVAPVTKIELDNIKNEFEPLLNELVCRIGQTKNIRKILINDRIYPVDVIANMTDEEACNSLQMNYAVVGVTDCSGDNIIIVPREKITEYNAIVKYVCR